MRTKIIYLLSLIAFSCTDQFLVEVPIPNSKREVVVNCVIEPHTTFVKAYLTYSKPIFGPVDTTYNFDVIEDADVTISGLQGSVQLFYNSSEKHYSATIDLGFFRPGETYVFQAITPDGEKVTSTTTIPYNQIKQMDVAVDSIRTTGVFAIDELLVNTWFNDIPGQEDYYMLHSFYQTGALNPNLIEIYYSTTYKLMTDKGQDGARLEQYGTAGHDKSGTHYRISLFLETVSRDFFLYYQGLNSYTEFYDPETPFVEPTIMNDNIEGGVGLFGSKNQKNFLFVIERN